MDLSIVVPCFNEESGLDQLRDALESVLPDLATDYEVILVDDGSSDDTLAQAQRICAETHAFDYVSLSRNFGKEAALLAGLRYARGERVGILDADLQHPPELLKKMMALLDAGYDQAVARRSREDEPRLRSAVTKLYYWGVNKLTDVRFEDGAGDFRLLSRRAVDALLALPESNRFSKGLFAWIGFPTATVPYSNVTRQVGTSKWTFGKLINYGMDGILSFNNKPLRAAIYVGSLMTVLAFCYAAFVIIHTLSTGIHVPGYTTLMVGIAGLGGVQLLFLGVMGEYLGRIYAETKSRPSYVIQAASRPKSKPKLRDYTTTIPEPTVSGDNAISHRILTRSTPAQDRSRSSEEPAVRRGLNGHSSPIESAHIVLPNQAGGTPQQPGAESPSSEDGSGTQQM